MRRILLGFLLGIGTVAGMGATVLYTADPTTEDYRGVTIQGRYEVGRAVRLLGRDGVVG